MSRNRHRPSTVDLIVDQKHWACQKFWRRQGVGVDPQPAPHVEYLVSGVRLLSLELIGGRQLG